MKKFGVKYRLIHKAEGSWENTIHKYYLQSKIIFWRYCWFGFCQSYNSENGKSYFYHARSIFRGRFYKNEEEALEALSFIRELDALIADESRSIETVIEL